MAAGERRNVLGGGSGRTGGQEPGYGGGGTPVRGGGRS